METKTLQVGSLTIAYRESPGKGPAAMLVHGNSSSSRSYQHQLDSPLGEKYRLVAIDLPGHGQSSDAVEPASTYTLPGYARVVASAAKQLGLEKAVFVGWSLGGHILLEASPQLPEAAGFMIYGTPPIAFPPAMAEAFLPHPAMAASFKADLTEAEMDAYVAAFFKPGSTDLPDNFKADIRRTDGRARSTMGGSIQPDGYLDEVAVVAHLTAPLAILHGEQEQLVNAAYIRALNMPTLWRNELQIVANAGHAPHWEQPEQFNALLEAFIQECTQ
jgi:pimeloyl-ACP methyl ester carboxylesterase